MTKTAYYTIYNYATHRTDLGSEDLSIHVEWMEYENIKARIIDTLTAKIDALGQDGNDAQ